MFILGLIVGATVVTAIHYVLNRRIKTRLGDKLLINDLLRKELNKKD